jgi:hypothetical protein
VRYVASRSEFMNGRRQKAPLLRYTELPPERFKSFYQD